LIFVNQVSDESWRPNYLAQKSKNVRFAPKANKREFRQFVRLVPISAVSGRSKN
jgi:hypothetical protein